jgi:single-stranded-DNA-specific exonuclease
MDSYIHGADLKSYDDFESAFRDLIQKRCGHLDASELNSLVTELGIADQPIFLHSPFLLPDFIPALNRLELAIERGEHILLYGDRDTDGVSSTAILKHFIRSRYPQIPLTAITSTQNEDYGLSPVALGKIRKLKPHLLITLDFGTSNYKEINELESEGIDSIILDHHEIPDHLPRGFLINPKRTDSRYPEKKICTAFLSLKFCLGYLLWKTKEKHTLYQDQVDLFRSRTFYMGIQLPPGFENSLPDMDKIAEFLGYPGRQLTSFPQKGESGILETLDRDKLPGSENLPIENRVFFFQLKRYPEILRWLYENSGLAGIGTITDMMPLLGENRSLVKLSCHYLSNAAQGKISAPPGLFALLQKTKLNPRKIQSKDLGWGLGPLLNAAGRMGKTEIAFELLCADSDQVAGQKSEELFKTNEERKERTKRNLFKMERYFERHPHKAERSVIFCFEPDLEPGVSGILATKISEYYSRPAIYITPDHGKARGSIRSYGGENVLDLLGKVSDVLEHFGGHPEAGGFSIELAKIPLLEEKVTDLGDDWLNGQLSSPEPKVSDLKLEPSDLTQKLYEFLERFEPTGQGNPPILLSLEAVEPLGLQFMGDGKHARFRILGCGNLKFVIWNSAEQFSKLLSAHSKVDLWGTLEENYFNGKTSLQFVVEHYRISKSS